VTFIKPNERANNHKIACGNYLALKNKARIFRNVTLLIDAADIQMLQKELKELAQQRDNLNQTGPEIPKGAYKKAKKGVATSESAYQVDLKEKE
jgi:hypothetical protein